MLYKLEEVGDEGYCQRESAISLNVECGVKCSYMDPSSGMKTSFLPLLFPINDRPIGSLVFSPSKLFVKMLKLMKIYYSVNLARPWLINDQTWFETNSGLNNDRAFNFSKLNFVLLILVCLVLPLINLIEVSNLNFKLDRSSKCILWFVWIS